MSTYLICALSIGGLGAAVWTLHSYYKRKYLRKLSEIKPPESRYWVGYAKGSTDMKELFTEWHFHFLPKPGVEVVAAYRTPGYPDFVMYMLASRREGENYLGSPDMEFLGWAHFPRMTHRYAIKVKDDRPMPPEAFIQKPLN